MIAAALLIIWGAGVFVTGDYVATLDISANLVSAGVITGALAAIARAIEKLPSRLIDLGLVGGAQAPEPDDYVEPEIAADFEDEPKTPREPAPAPAIPSAKAPEPPAKAPEPRPAVAEPKLVREGVIDGRVYRYYEDGSIHADGPDGPRRFGSIDELRAEVLGRAKARAGAPALAVPAGTERGGFGAAPDAGAPGMSHASAHDAGHEDFVRHDLRSSFEEGDAVADPHVDEPRGSAWAGPFRSLLSRGRKDRDTGRDDDSEPRF